MKNRNLINTRHFTLDLTLDYSQKLIFRNDDKNPYFCRKHSITMSSITIKSDLQKMIAEQDDINVLEAIYTLLQKTSLNPELKIKLTSRAKKAEEDIVSGRVFTKDEVIQKTNRIG